MKIEIIILIVIGILGFMFLINKYIINKNDFSNKKNKKNVTFKENVNIVEKYIEPVMINDYDDNGDNIDIDISNNISNDKIKVILCSAKWCGHCTHFMPTWKELVELFNNKFNFIMYDADIDTDRENIQKYKVTGFPTLLIEKNDEMINKYIGGRSLEELSEYLNSLL
jgi:thioredoxin 1